MVLRKVALASGGIVASLVAAALVVQGTGLDDPGDIVLALFFIVVAIGLTAVVALRLQPN